jgi:hypothetical protein
MALNAKKTKTMLMGSSRKLSLLHYELQLYFDDECLNNVDTHKLLGGFFFLSKKSKLDFPGRQNMFSFLF